MQAPKRPSPAEDLAGSAWAIMSAFVRGFDPTRELRQTLELGRGSGRVKTLLGLADGPLSVAQLAHTTGVDAPYTTLIVNELQALGLVSRTSDERDRRRKLVALTARGREAVDTAQGIITRPPAALRALTPGDLADLHRILQRLSHLQEDGVHTDAPVPDERSSRR